MFQPLKAVKQPPRDRVSILNHLSCTNAHHQAIVSSIGIKEEMGNLFSSTGKRPLPQEAESAASHPSHNVPPQSSTEVNHNNHLSQPPLKRRRIDPHNDPIMPYYVPPSVTTKTIEDIETTQHPRNINNNRTGERKQEEYGGETTPLRKQYKKKKFAILMGYNGGNYHGMQINRGVVTIEETLMDALLKANVISEENHSHPSKINLMRAARTDKGVSAAIQCVSVKLEMTEEMKQSYNNDNDNDNDNGEGEEATQIVKNINKQLPKDIRIYGLLRTTPSFNARQDCDKRRYEYIFPLHLLGGSNKVLNDINIDGITDSRIIKLNKILKKYEGTHCFANFTEGLKSNDDQSKRYMISVKCLPTVILPPVDDSKLYYVVIEILGQSFLLHQIRKMIGLAMIIYYGYLPEEALALALSEDLKMVVPTAPADGLLLDNLYFDLYNKRFRNKSGFAIKIGDQQFGKLKSHFKLHGIYKQIAESECSNHHLQKWFHNSEAKITNTIGKLNIMDLYQKYILSDMGKRQKRELYIKSLYPIKLNMNDFLSISSNDNNVDKTQLSHVNNLKSSFEKRFGTMPTFLTRAPGRCILIGEHLDYNGFPVISFALRQSTLIAGCLDDGSELVDVVHSEDETYKCDRFHIDCKQQKNNKNEEQQLQTNDQRDTQWLTYVMHGLNSLAEHLNYKRTVKGGGRLLFSSDLPTASGLASSSSLTVASMLAGGRLSRKRIPKEIIADLSSKAEQNAIGTKGGCIDHVTSMFGVKNKLCHVEFVPKLNIQYTNWFDNNQVKIYLINSKIKAQKGVSTHDDAHGLKNEFNWRCSECKIAAAIAAKRLNVHLAKSVCTLSQLWLNARRTYEIIDKRKKQNGGKEQAPKEEEEEEEAENDQDSLTVPELAKMVYEVVKEDEALRIEDATSELEKTDNEMQNRFIACDDENMISNRKLQIGKRIRHIFSEVERVARFQSTLDKTDEKVDDKVCELGQILNEGHESLRKWYESSLPQVDELVEFCRQNGAIGSRMTGAGWGGTIVNLVRNENSKHFEETLIQKVGKENVLQAEPWDGACIFAIHQKLDGERNN